MLLSGLPETTQGLSDFVGQRLAAYSCGGSSGFGFFGRTGFPLSFGPNEPEEPRRVHLPTTQWTRQLDCRSRTGAAVVHSFNSEDQNFCAACAGAIDSNVQIAPDVVVTVHHDAIRGG
jgi:hypothetical protein